MKSTLQVIDGFVEKFEAAIMYVMCLGLAFVGVFAVVMRNIANSGFTDLPLLERHAVVWIAVIGASLATKQGGHLSIDLLPRFLQGSKRQLYGRVNAFLCAMISLVLVYVAIKFWLIEFEAGSNLAFGIKLWLVQLVLPLGLIVSTSRYFLQIFLPLSAENHDPANTEELKEWS
jgi:TRAP-type C4-dicarboxylate transport system permease small subunit